MQLLAENVPAAGPLREVVQNILNEPVPQRVKERLSKPLLPGKNKPITPPRKQKEIKRRERGEVKFYHVPPTPEAKKYAAMRLRSLATLFILVAILFLIVVKDFIHLRVPLPAFKN